MLICHHHHPTAQVVETAATCIYIAAHLVQRCVLWKVVLEGGVVGGPVVGSHQRPPPVVAVVLVAPVEQVAVEEDGVSRSQFHMNQWENLMHGERTQHS